MLLSSVPFGQFKQVRLGPKYVPEIGIHGVRNRKVC